LNLGFLQNSDLILAIVRIIRDSNWAIKENYPKTKVFDLLKIENTLSFQWIIGSPENGGKGLMDVLKAGGKDGFSLNVQAPHLCFQPGNFLLTGYWNGL
jgi:hypothetical protein